MSRRIDRLLIDQHGVDHAAHLDQLLPVPAVAGEARDLACADGADLAEADFGNHALKAGALHAAGGGAAKIVINDLDVKQRLALQMVRPLSVIMTGLRP